jgi:hypothetical protein
MLGLSLDEKTHSSVKRDPTDAGQVDVLVLLL